MIDNTQDTDPADEAAATASHMVDLLGRLPLAAYEAALANGSTTVEVELVDYAAASDITGLERPAASDIEASVDWIEGRPYSAPIEEGGTGFAIRMPRFPGLISNTLLQSDAVAAELGFSLLEPDRWATLTGKASNIAVVEGDELTLAPNLVDRGGGVVSAGEGEDGQGLAQQQVQGDDENNASFLERQLEFTTPARTLGFPLRLASNGNMIAASLYTPHLESWLAGGPSMLDVTDFALAVEALDSAGSVSGFLIESEFKPAGYWQESGYGPLFRVVAIGTTMVAGRPGNAMVFVFDDEAAAAVALPEVERAWTSGTLSWRSDSEPLLPVADFFDIQTVEQRGRLVVLTTAITDISNTSSAWAMLTRPEPIFANDWETIHAPK